MLRPEQLAPPVPAPPTAVRGGSHGLAAAYAELRAIAAAYDTAGSRLRDQAGLTAASLTDGDLLESAVLAPLSFAEAEAAVLAAVAGPRGLVVASLSWETDALLVRVSVEAFEAADELVRLTFEAIDYSLGVALGLSLSCLLVGGVATAALWVPPAALAAGGVVALAALLPPPLRERLRAAGGRTGDGLAVGIQEWVATHPGVVEHLSNGAGGLVDGFWDGLTPGLPSGPVGLPTFTPSAEAAGALLAGLYPPEGSPELVERPDLASGGSVAVPGSVADVMAHLEQVSAWSTDEHPENNGTIEIQSWTGADGVRRHLVYLPGTDDLTTAPWTSDGDVRDLPADLLVVGGRRTTYAAGILEALHRAGIGPDDPVLLAGHSQGGLEAAWIASHTDEFHVTQVITAGAPIAVLGDYPTGTHVLSLEHTGDVVPLLEGEANPDAVNHVTVTFDDHGASLAGNHEIARYVDGAAGVDASTHPSITDQLRGMHAQGFLTGQGADVECRAFRITRSDHPAG